MTILYFDLIGGAAGDMLLASLLDTGQVTLDDLGETLSRLQSAIPESFDIDWQDQHRHGPWRSSLVTVKHSDATDSRGLPEIFTILKKAQLPEAIDAKVRAVFQSLAQAEARVHGVALEAVHFHEVGAVDAIVDICSVVSAIDFLKPERILCSPLPLSQGQAQTAHGAMPLPAPAVLELLQSVNAPIRACGTGPERVTPTGAALLTSLAEGFGDLPSMQIKALGVGAGHRQLPHKQANIIRCYLGHYPSSDESTLEATAESVLVLKTNIDDQSPEQLAHLMTSLFANGAIDVYAQACLMKKGRLGQELTVLSSSDALPRLEQLIFQQSSTLGIRRSRAQRSVLQRELLSVTCSYGHLRVKVGRLDGRVVTLSPEFDDCQALAEAQEVPLKWVYSAAQAAAEAQLRGEI